MEQVRTKLDAYMREALDEEAENELERLKDIYQTYERELVAALRNAKPLAGWFGISNDDPRNDPCHKAFYDAVGRWIEDFVALEPRASRAMEAAVWILDAAFLNRGKPSYWYYLAAQGYVKELLPFLSKEQCAALMKGYDKAYPRRERLPVNDELYSLMKKAAK